jgi:hypothetical protein
MADGQELEGTPRFSFDLPHDSDLPFEEAFLCFGWWPLIERDAV